MVVQVVKEMYGAEIFDKKEMFAWENKAEAQKTWANAKAYFEALYKNKQQYSDAKANKLGYGSINQV